MQVIGKTADRDVKGVIVILDTVEYHTLITLAEATGTCSEIREETWDAGWKEAFLWVDSLVRLVWEEYPIRLEGQSKKRFEKSIEEYVDYTRNKRQVPVQLEPSNLWVFYRQRFRSTTRLKKQRRKRIKNRPQV